MTMKPIDLRDQFAMAALQGILASGTHHGNGITSPAISVLDAREIALDAYALADKMLEARAPSPPNPPTGDDVNLEPT